MAHLNPAEADACRAAIGLLTAVKSQDEAVIALARLTCQEAGMELVAQALTGMLLGVLGFLDGIAPGAGERILHGTGLGMAGEAT